MAVRDHGAAIAGDVAPARTPVELGRKIFEHNFGQPETWTEKKPLGEGGDGLGPLFNDFSCVACHQQGGVGGAGSNDQNALIVTFTPAPGLSRAALEGLVREASQVHPELSGTQTSAPLHRFGLASDPDRPNPDRPNYEEHLAKLFDRLKFDSQVTTPASAANALVGWEIGQRNTTALWGAGAIDELRRRDGDGVRRHLLEEQNRKFNWLSGRLPRDANQTPGWFGWRGQIASLHDFNLGACATELGLTVPGVKDHASPVALVNPAEKRLDLCAAECEAVTAFVATLPTPRQVLPDDAAAAERVTLGEQVFHRCHCDACHVRDLGFITGIYSDLLLHDMGLRLCDRSPANAELEPGEFIARGFNALPAGEYYAPKTNIFAPPKVKPTNCECEWRTPPLWGCADSAPYLHDGRAATLDDAIRWHGGEGETSHAAYEVLTPAERSLLLAFLESLRAPQATPSVTVLAAVTNVPPAQEAHAPQPAGEAAVPVLAVPPADVAAAPHPAVVPVPPADIVMVPTVEFQRLQELLGTLKPSKANLDQATALSGSLTRQLPDAGSGAYALALFQKRALQHGASISALQELAETSGLYAARARRAIVFERIRAREFAAAFTVLQQQADELARDVSLSPRDAAELAESAGVISAWLRGPAGLDATRFEPDRAIERVRSTLTPPLVVAFDAGVARTESQFAALRAERAALVGLETQQLAADQASLTQRQGELAQQQGDVLKSREQAQTQLNASLARIDTQLVDLEKQYTERDGIEQRLAAQVAPLQFRSNSILAGLLEHSTNLSNASLLADQSRNELSSLTDQINVLNRQREDNGTQARIVAIKAQQLVEQRAAAVAAYTRQTGQAVQQLESLAKWQGRFAKQAEKLGESTADQSQRVKRLDRKIKELATYERFDAEDEARRMLARYRPAE